MTNDQIAQLLSSKNDLHYANLKDIAKETDHEMSLLSTKVATMFAYAFGTRYYPILQRVFPAAPQVRNAYLENMKMIATAIQSVKSKGSFVQTVEKNSFYQLHIAEKLWRPYAIRSMPYPYHMGIRDVAADEKRRITLAYHLFHIISKNPIEEPSSFQLIPLYNTMALLIPSDREPIWISWGSLVEAYISSGGKLLNQANKVLSAFPFRTVLNAFKTETNTITDSPLVYRGPRFQEFRSFVSLMTVKAMEQFFGCKLSEETTSHLQKVFEEDEILRKDITVFLIDPTRRITSAKNKKLYLKCRIAMNFLKNHVSSTYRAEAAQAVDWIFKSNQKYIGGIALPEYPVEIPCNLNHLILLVSSLQFLYEKNGECFEETAFSLLLILIPMQEAEGFVQFIRLAGEYDHAIISTKQILDYSHFDGQRDYQEERERLEAIAKFLPQRLALSSEFFNLVAQKNYPLPIDKIEEFNQAFLGKKRGEIPSDPYFTALRQFLSETLDLSYVEVFRKQSADYSKASLEKQLEVLVEASPYIDRARVPGILWVLNHFPKQLTAQQVKSLFIRPLSLLPQPLSEDRAKSCLETLRTLEYPFTIEEELFLFYELMSLQGKEAQEHSNLQFIQVVEAHLRHPLSHSAVATFLSYHPRIDLSKIEKIFREFKETPATAIAKFQDALADRDREFNYHRVREYIETPIGVIQHSLYSTSLLLETRSLTSFIPKTCFAGVTEKNFKRVEALGKGDNMLIRFKEVDECVELPKLFSPPYSPHEALMPLSLKYDLNKGIYGSWEVKNGMPFFYLTLVSLTDHRSYSTSALFPFPIADAAKEADLFFLIKAALYHFASSDQKQIDLLDNEPFVEVWNTFYSYTDQKLKILNALTLFIGQLVPNLKEAVLNLSTNHKYANYDKSAQTLNINTYLEIAGTGDIFPYENHHLIVPPHLFRKKDRMLPFFGTAAEMTPPEMAASSSSDTSYSSFDALLKKRLCVTRDGFTPLHLPFSVKREETEIHYDDTDYNKLDRTAVSFESKGVQVTLEIILDGELIAVTVVYPEKIGENLSWQIALLKSRVYEKIREGQRPPTCDSSLSSSSHMVAGSSDSNNLK